MTSYPELEQMLADDDQTSQSALMADAHNCNRRLRRMMREQPCPNITVPGQMSVKTIKRAKTKCSCCDRLLSPDEVRHHGRDVFCGAPLCKTRLDRWRRR